MTTTTTPLTILPSGPFSGVDPTSRESVERYLCSRGYGTDGSGYWARATDVPRVEIQIDEYGGADADGRTILRLLRADDDTTL